jgi:hypothetical protein
MYRLSVCTKPRYQSYVAMDDVKLLATSLELMFELIVDGTDLSRLMKLPKEVQSLVLSHLAPFPEVVALPQTRALLHQLQSSRAPCDSIMFANVNTRLYPSTLTYQGREYISRVIDTHTETQDIVRLNCPETISSLDWTTSGLEMSLPLTARMIVAYIFRAWTQPWTTKVIASS